MPAAAPSSVMIFAADTDDDDADDDGVAVVLPTASSRPQEAAAAAALTNSNNKTKKQWKSNTLLGRYLQLLDERPQLTRSIVGAILGALAGMLGNVHHHHHHHHQPSTTKQQQQQSTSYNWTTRVLGFATAGAVMARAGVSWEAWMEKHGPEEKSLALLFDLIVADPPRILLTYVLADVAQAAWQQLPTSLQQTSSHLLSPTLMTSWRFWPVVVYFMTRFLKKRRHYMVGMDVCSLFWMSQLVKRRARLEAQQQGQPPASTNLY